MGRVVRSKVFAAAMTFGLTTGDLLISPSDTLDDLRCLDANALPNHVEDECENSQRSDIAEVMHPTTFAWSIFFRILARTD